MRDPVPDLLPSRAFVDPYPIRNQHLVGEQYFAASGSMSLAWQEGVVLRDGRHATCKKCS